MKSSNQGNQTLVDFSKKKTPEKFFSGNEQKKTGFFDQLLGRKPVEQAPRFHFPNQRKEFTIFAHDAYREEELVPREIEQLKAEIRQEIEALKKVNSQVVTEAAQIQKAALETVSYKGGVYHVRFLEVLLQMLRALRSKVGEAKTWLTAMHTKKKKRGSLFAARSKKQGTQYSLSQELQNTRSIQ